MTKSALEVPCALCVTVMSASSDCDSLERSGEWESGVPLCAVCVSLRLSTKHYYEYKCSTLALSPLAGHCIELRQRHHMQATL